MWCDWYNKKAQYDAQPEVIFYGSKPTKKPAGYVRVVCLGETYGDYTKLPIGDILIHTGNFTESNDMYDVYEFSKYLCNAPSKYKVIIPGECENHTTKQLLRAISPPTNIFLDGESSQILNIKIGTAGKMDPDSIIEHNPFTTVSDIIISHIPPFNILDRDEIGFSYGSKLLADNLAEYPPRVCIFAGVAAGHGARYKHGTLFINCGIYGYLNDEKIKYGVPLVFDISVGK